MKNKSLRVNAFLNSLQTLLNLIFPLITFPYVSRILSVDGIGKYNFSNSIVSYFLLIAGLGINRYAVREGAKIRNDRNKFSEFASRIFTINLCSMFISYILLFILLKFVPTLRIYESAILIFSTQIFFTTIGTDWVYTIYEEYGYITIRNVIFKLISIVLLLMFVRKKNDYLNYVAISVFSSTGSYILKFFHAKKICSIRIVWKFNWKEYLIPIMVIFGTMAAVTIYVSSDITILGFLKNNYVVGLYSISTKIYGMLGPMLSATMAVTIPRLAMMMGQNKREEYLILLDKLLQTMIVIITPASLGLIMTSKYIILLIAGNNYLRSTSSLQILSLALFFGTINTIFVECVLIPAKRERQTLISAVLSACLNVLLNFILIPSLAENGAALTTVLSELAAMFSNYYFSRDIVASIFLKKEFWKNFFSVVFGCVGIFMFSFSIDYYLKLNLIIKLFILVIGSALIYIIILRIVNNKMVNEIINKYRINI